MSEVNGGITTLMVISKTLRATYTLTYTPSKDMYVLKMVGVKFENSDILKLMIEVTQYFMKNNKSVKDKLNSIIPNIKPKKK